MSLPSFARACHDPSGRGLGVVFVHYKEFKIRKLKLNFI